MQDEQSLVQRARQLDEEALAELYEKYFDKIYRYVVIKIGNRIEAEDLTQQVFINMLRSISSYKWKGKPFSAWLFRIAHNLVVDYLRRKSKLKTDSIEGMEVRDNSNPQMEIEHKSEVERVLLATKRLTEAQREVISLRFTSELAIAEVANIMGKSQGAIKALQHSAIIALRKALMVAENG